MLAVVAAFACQECGRSLRSLERRSASIFLRYAGATPLEVGQPTAPHPVKPSSGPNSCGEQFTVKGRGYRAD